MYCEVIEERIVRDDGLKNTKNVSKLVHAIIVNSGTDTLRDECSPVVGIGPVLIDSMPMLICRKIVSGKRVLSLSRTMAR